MAVIYPYLFYHPDSIIPTQPKSMYTPAIDTHVII
jgi:hypothetical protein